MTKRSKRNVAAFARVQAKSPQYLASPYTLHEQAIREHVRRGFAEGLRREAFLIDQANKVVGL